MRHLTGVSAIFALILSTAAAYAASGPGTGKYAFVQSEMCEAQLTVTKDIKGKVTGVNLNKPGKMEGGTGYITFTPTSPGASSGTAAITGSITVRGGAVRVDTNGSSWQPQANNRAATAYSFTATTFTYGGQVYHMVGSNLVSGVYRNVYLMRQDTAGDGNTDCVITISATRVAP